MLLGVPRLHLRAMMADVFGELWRDKQDDLINVVEGAGITANNYQKLSARTLNGLDIRPNAEQTELLERALYYIEVFGNYTEATKKHVFHGKEARPTSITDNIVTRLLLGDPDDATLRLVNYALGAVGESAEIANEIAIGWQSGEFDKIEIAKEIGDALWYLAAICTLLDLNLGDIMQTNIAKLEARYPDGFSVDHSRDRRD